MHACMQAGKQIDRHNFMSGGKQVDRLADMKTDKHAHSEIRTHTGCLDGQLTVGVYSEVLDVYGSR